MIIFPAIDLKDGQCVRLKRGIMDDATIFNDDPVAQAQIFVTQGFRYLHLVDLNGAFSGRSVNEQAIMAILKAVNIPIQLGGGIRSLANIVHWLERGISRVILGTIALREPALVKQAAKLFPNQIVVALDARQDRVAVAGWAQTTEINIFDLAKCFEDAGISAIIFTDIERDGLLSGLNLEKTLALAHHVSVPIIASGGVSSLEDLKRLSLPDCAVLEGVICGRALYDGRLDPAEVLELFAHA